MEMAGATDIAIIGAGLSGLVAARRLCAAGRKVAVLEARSRVGGRTLGGEIAGLSVDLGGQWVGPGQTFALKLLEELGVKTFPQYNEGRHVLELKGRRTTYKGLIPQLPLFALIAISRAMAAINRQAREMTSSDAPDARALEFDRLTAEEGLNALTRNESARAVLTAATRAVFSAEPRDFSFAWFLSYVRAAGSIERLADVKGAAQQDRISGGAFDVPRRLAAELPEGVLQLGAPVRRIEGERGRFRITHDRGALEAGRVIIALAPALGDAISVSCAHLQKRAAAARRMPMGRVVKSLLAYETPFWRGRGLSGQAVSDAGPFGPVFDASAPGSKLGLIVGFFEGEAADATLARGPGVRRELASHCVRRWFGPHAPEPTHYVEHDWVSDPWSRGCYVGLMKPGAFAELGPLLRRPVDGVHFAGTETARQWIGYLDGAIEAGERAAGETLE